MIPCMNLLNLNLELKRKGFILLIIIWVVLNIGCSYLVKNDHQRVYSRAKYGNDRFIMVDPYWIHYVEVGEGDPLFLIPGAFSTYRDWNKLIPILSKSFRVLALDYLGVGDSDKPTSGFNYTIEEQADLIVKMAERLQIPKFHIAGVSYGGVIALNLATRYPEKVNRVVCIEGGVIKPKRLPHQYKKEILRVPLVGHFIISAIRSGLFDRITAQVVMGEAWEKLPDEEKVEILEIISLNNKTASQGSWSKIARTFKNSKEFVEDVKTLRTPVLYLYGKSSEFRKMTEMNVELFNRHLSHIEIVSFEDGIHNLELQKPREVAELMLEFFNRDAVLSHQQVFHGNH